MTALTADILERKSTNTRIAESSWNAAPEKHLSNQPREEILVLDGGISMKLKRRWIRIRF
jgi:hypothetical protein